MKEGRIIFPVNGNGHKEQTWIDKVVKTFGGATLLPGYGHWIDPNGMQVDEPIRVLDVAYEASGENDQKLFNLAKEYLIDCGETEVYLRYGNGEVQLVRVKDEMDNGHSDMEYAPEFSGVLKAITDLVDEGKSFEERLSAFEFLEDSVIHHKHGVEK